jgi:hypothetical protein
LIKPTREEFEVDGDFVRHTPTGYCMKFHPGSRDTGIAEIGQLGCMLADGRRYEPDDIRTMVRDVRKAQLARRMFFPEE